MQKYGFDVTNKYLFLVPIVIFEIWLIVQYVNHEAFSHYATHLLIGVITAIVINTIFILVQKPPTNLLITGFLWHQYAMFPDYLNAVGITHQTWMNVFLGHVIIDIIPHHELLLIIVCNITAGVYWITIRRTMNPS